MDSRLTATGSGPPGPDLSREPRAVRWQALARGFWCPVAVSAAPGQITLYGRNAAGHLLRMSCDGDDAWSGPDALGMPTAHGAGSDVAVPVDWQLAAACDGTHAWLVARSPDGALLELQCPPDREPAFRSLGTPALDAGGGAMPMGVATAPAVCGSDGRLDAFALTASGELLHAVRTGDDWGEFQALGRPRLQVAGLHPQPVPVQGGPAACRCEGGEMAVFLVAQSGLLLFKWWDGTSWSDFASLGSPELRAAHYPAVTAAAPLTGPPAACSPGGRRLDVFARGPRGELMRRRWDGERWGRFESLGMPPSGNARQPLSGTYAVVCPAPGRVDVFASTTDGVLWWLGHLT